MAIGVDRIPGSNDFVKRMIEEADERLKVQLSADRVQEEADGLTPLLMNIRLS